MKLLENIFEASNMISIYLTVIVTFIIFKLKFQFDQKKYYNEIMKDKLENVFSPIVLSIKFKESSENIIDENVLSILRKNLINWVRSLSTLL